MKSDDTRLVAAAGTVIREAPGDRAIHIGLTRQKGAQTAPNATSSGHQARPAKGPLYAAQLGLCASHRLPCAKIGLGAGFSPTGSQPDVSRKRGGPGASPGRHIVSVA